MINVRCRDTCVTKIFGHYWAISYSALNQFFPQNLLLIFAFTKSWRNRCKLWVWRPTGRTFVLLHSTHVHALGLIAVASKFVGVCHRTTNWFFRETRQLLTRCQRCKILLRSHSSLLDLHLKVFHVHFVYDTMFLRCYNAIIYYCITGLWSLNQGKDREITLEIFCIQFSKQILLNYHLYCYLHGKFWIWKVHILMK